MSEKKTKNLEQFGRVEKLAIAAFIFLITIGVFGASGLAERIINIFTDRPANQNFQNSSQPLNPVTSNTPQLSKELIYSGSRLVAVEDANANAAPPADLAVWRPSSGDWYVINSNQQWTIQQFGSNGDVPIQGDYDGDGKTDFSVWRPATNFWYVLNSGNGAWYGFNYGTAGDQPIIADFDGDGRTDFTLFRASNQEWYLNRTSDPSYVGTQQFGYPGDIPAPADYDGDGRADYAVWRPSSQIFVVLRSSNGQIEVNQVGLTSSDKPVSGDYDGDGKADYAVRSGNNWIIKQSSNNQTQSIVWQQASDIAVQNDYDGDGKVDIAVWRDSNGMWYIRNSSTGALRQQQWGISGDIPVPAFYRR